MKKVILGVALVISSFGLAQDIQKKNTISVVGDISVASSFLFAYERHADNSKIFKLPYSVVCQFGSSSLGVSNSLGQSAYSEGYLASVGLKLFFNKLKANYGWNVQNSIEYGSHKFTVAAKGEFAYLSIVNPTFGYKFKIGPIAIEPQLGFKWITKTNSSGNLTNLSTNHTDPILTLRTGYMF